MLNKHNDSPVLESRVTVMPLELDARCL